MLSGLAERQQKMGLAMKLFAKQIVAENPKIVENENAILPIFRNLATMAEIDFDDEYNGYLADAYMDKAEKLIEELEGTVAKPNAELSGQTGENFNFENIEETIAELKAGITPLPFLEIQYSTLGGKDQVTLLITLGFDEKSTWSHGIFENSRMARFRYEKDGTLEMFQKHYKMPTKFRKATAKNVQDAISRINKFIAEVK